MAIYKGFSTRHVNFPRSFDTTGTGRSTINNPTQLGRKFRLTDSELVVNDLMNALSIQRGEKVGNPGYGSSLKTFLFEPNTPEVQDKVSEEIRRVVAEDPRILLNTIAVFPKESGILIEMEIAVTPFNTAEQLSVFLDKGSGKLTLQ